MPLVRKKLLRWVGSVSDQFRGEGPFIGDDRGKDQASPDIAGHGQS